MSFADLADQRQPIALLQRSLDLGRLGHAYLLTGSRLTEPEAVARTLAKTLNCLRPPERGSNGVALDCCDACLACRKIDQDIHPDVLWIRPESKSRVITVDQIREARQMIHLKATEAEYKVTVVVAADRLNTQAANAFLKTLEEPPDRSVLSLLTTEPQKMLETLVSRCLRINLGVESGPPMDPPQIAWLVAFGELAAGERNGLLDHYRLLGALLSRLSLLKDEIEKDISAKSPLTRYQDVDSRLRERWEEELTAAVEAEYRRRRGETLSSLQWWLRDVWMSSQRLGADWLSLPQLKRASESVGQRIGPRRAVENLQVIEQTQRLLQSNVQEALALEVGFLKLNL